MKIIITGKNLELSKALKDYTEKKVKTLKKYFEHIIEVDAVLNVSKSKKKDKKYGVEVTLWANGVILHGKELCENMYSAIDKVVNKLEKQIKKYKSKLKKHPKQKLSEKIAVESMHKIVSINDTEEKSEVIRSHSFVMKPMFVEEAIDHLKSLGQDFFVFRNATTNEVNVIYKRKDKAFGLIEPEA